MRHLLLAATITFATLGLAGGAVAGCAGGPTGVPTQGYYTLCWLETHEYAYPGYNYTLNNLGNAWFYQEHEGALDGTRAGGSASVGQYAYDWEVPWYGGASGWGNEAWLVQDAAANPAGSAVAEATFVGFEQHDREAHDANGATTTDRGAVARAGVVLVAPVAGPAAAYVEYRQHDVDGQGCRESAAVVRVVDGHVERTEVLPSQPCRAALPRLPWLGPPLGWP